MMRAWIQDRYGPSDVFRLGDVAIPDIGPEDVLLRVHATSINAADRYSTLGVPLVMRVGSGLRRPKRRVAGSDAAGVVVAVGGAVTRFQPGDRVVGQITGAWAEYATAREAALAPMPRSGSFADAAALPLAGLTALQGLRDHGHVRPGQRVLVNGASGGVGTFAVQVAVALGATVTAVCSTSKVATATELGAAEVIDYTTTDVFRTLADRGERFDVVFDLAGADSVRRRAMVLAPGGVCLVAGGPRGGKVFGPITGLVRSLIGGWFVHGRFRTFVSASNGDDVGELVRLVDTRQLRSVIDRTYRFDELPKALTAFESGHTAGKLVVEVAAEHS